MFAKFSSVKKLILTGSLLMPLACSRSNDVDSKTSAIKEVVNYLLHPYAIPELCNFITGQRIVDHREDPPKVTYIWRPFLVNCDPKYPNPQNYMYINDLQKKDWDGKSENLVQFRQYGLNQCLTNVAKYNGTPDDGDIQFQPCSDPTKTSAVEHMRQFFQLKINSATGALRIASHLQYTLGVPNAKPECIERKPGHPNALYRTTCAQLGNWAVTKKITRVNVP